MVHAMLATGRASTNSQTTCEYSDEGTMAHTVADRRSPVLALRLCCIVDGLEGGAPVAARTRVGASSTTR